MAKTMARLENGTVVNLEWVNDNTQSTNELKDIYDLHINIGDSYTDGKFYRNGVEIISHRQQIRNVLSNYDKALTEIEDSIGMPTLLSITKEAPPTISERKQNILSRINDILTALDLLEVTPSD